MNKPTIHILTVQTGKHNLFFLISIFLFSTTLQSCLFSKVDRTPYKQTAYYKTFQQISDTISASPIHGDTIKAGWAKVNITPTKKVRLAGYGSRIGKKSTGIHDSLYIRAFVFNNGKSKSALITSDLLIMPPEIVEKLTKKLPALGWNIDQIYFSAIHTHNSLGGWAPKLTGSLIAGKHRRKTVKKLTNFFMEVIPKAEKNIEAVKIGFQKYEAYSQVQNRLVDFGPVDPWIRTAWLQKSSGKAAVIMSYQAHPTNLEDKEMHLSGDYPNELVKLMEKSGKVDFAAFCAGGVGSHSPKADSSNFVKIINIATPLSQKILSQVPNLKYETELTNVRMPLPLRKPQWRVFPKNVNKKIRPWLFYWFFGNVPSSMTFLRIGDIIFAGMPCDFSGMLTANIESDSLLKGKNLIITSFNGGYIGYITPDQYYDYGSYETRDMNWFGPENGAYFTEAILKIISKMK